MSFSRQAVYSLALTGLYAVMAMAITVTAARVLGIEGYGLYASVIAHISLIGILVSGGVPMLLVREMTAADYAGDMSLLRGALGRARIWVLLTTALVLCVSGVIWLLAGSDATWWQIFWPGLGITVGLGLLDVQGAALRALGQPVRGQIPGSLLRPGLHLAALAALASLGTGVAPLHAVLAFLGAVLAALAASGWMLWRSLAPRARAAPRYTDRVWLTALGGFFVAGGFVRANQQIGGVMLEHLSTRDQVALFLPVMQMVMLMLLGQQAIAAVLTPRLKQAMLGGDAAEQQRLLSISTAGMLATALLVAILLLLVGPGGMAAIFGEGFEALYPVLVVMAGGQAVALCFGHPLVVLNLAGHERVSAAATGLAFLLNLALGLGLVPSLGAVGAALAAAAAQIAISLSLSVQCRQRLGLRTDIAALLGRP